MKKKVFTKQPFTYKITSCKLVVHLGFSLSLYVGGFFLNYEVNNTRLGSVGRLGPGSPENENG